jgi:hypothetical protein
MYSPPPAVVPVTPARRGFTQGPLLAICCLGIILFLIAATIVLALIPLYIPKKTLTPGGTSSSNSFTLTPQRSGRKRDASNQPLGDDGNLDATATANINSAVKMSLNIKTRKFIYILYRLRPALVSLQMQLPRI